MPTCNRFLAVYLFALFLVPVRLTLGEEIKPNGDELADALLTIQGDEQTWFRSAGLFAYCLELGISEDQFRQTHPGARLDEFPAIVLATLRLHAGGISSWIDCLKDERATGISENDLFGGGSSENAKKRTCGDAAAVIVDCLLPASAANDPADNALKGRERLATAASKWEESVRDMAPAERMTRWFEAADTNQRRMFLAIAIQTHHAPAYPLLDADFLKRAKTVDDFYYLELSAYVRHRRASAKQLVEQVVAELRKNDSKEIDSDEREFFFSMWKLLSDYDTMELAVEDWIAGRMPLNQLGELLERSVDQPWAYHSMAIEPISVSRPTMERNLKTLIAAAAREQDVVRRITLLSLGSSAAMILTEINSRVTPVELSPPPQSDSSEWQPAVSQLRELFRDKRQGFDGDTLESPAERAADIVWELWGPNGRTYDGKVAASFSDWRPLAANRFDGSCRSLIVAAATDFLDRPAIVQPQPYPEQQATELAKDFAEGDAAAWRKKLERLSWDQRLLLQAKASNDSKFAHSMWPRLIEFVDWNAASQGEPASFATLWRENLADRKLDASTWRSLQDWLVSEAKEDRYWTIVGESYPIRPGITLNILLSSKRSDQQNPQPILENCLESGGLSPSARRESFQIGADGLDEIEIEDDRSGRATLPRPIEAIKAQSAKTFDDDWPCDHGYSFAMIVVPPTK